MTLHPSFRAPRRAIGRAVLAMLLVSVLLPLAACGRKGQPEPPPGADYPRIYPNEPKNER